MNFTPSILHEVILERGRAELVEWRWPDIIDFLKIELELMLEMSVAPYATDASAEFPLIAPGNRCFMGTLFVRYPGVAVHGRGEGGQIRVVRFVFSSKTAELILPTQDAPVLRQLQSLLDIKSESLRGLMRLAHRELTNGVDRSVEALEAILNLVTIELRRLLERQLPTPTTGRLAAWQYRRIRERLIAGPASPTAIEAGRIMWYQPAPPAPSVPQSDRQHDYPVYRAFSDRAGQGNADRDGFFDPEHRLRLRVCACQQLRARLSPVDRRRAGRLSSKDAGNKARAIVDSRKFNK